MGCVQALIHLEVRWNLKPETYDFL
jgi:hypothetical protein